MADNSSSPKPPPPPPPPGLLRDAGLREGRGGARIIVPVIGGVVVCLSLMLGGVAWMVRNSSEPGMAGRANAVGEAGIPGAQVHGNSDSQRHDVVEADASKRQGERAEVPSSAQEDVRVVSVGSQTGSDAQGDQGESGSQRNEEESSDAGEGSDAAGPAHTTAKEPSGNERRKAFDLLVSMPDTVPDDLPVGEGLLGDSVKAPAIDLGEFDGAHLVGASFGLAYPRDSFQGHSFLCDVVPDADGWRIEVREQAIDGTSRMHLASLIPRDGHLYLEVNGEKATLLHLAFLRRCVLLVRASDPDAPQADPEVRRAIRLIRPSGGVLSMDVNPRVTNPEVLSLVGRVPPSLVIGNNGQICVLPGTGCRVEGEVQWLGFSPDSDGSKQRRLSFATIKNDTSADTTTLVTLPVGQPSVVFETQIDFAKGNVESKTFLAGAKPDDVTLQGLGQIALNPQDRRKGLHGKIRDAFKKARKEFNDADAKSVQRGIEELERAVGLLSLDLGPLVQAIREQESIHNARLRELGGGAVQKLMIEWREFVRDDIKPRLDVLEEAALTGASLVAEAVAPLANPVRVRISGIEAEAFDGNQRYPVPLFVSDVDDRPLPGEKTESGNPDGGSGLD
jgi:hypothetical protein